MPIPDAIVPIVIMVAILALIVVVASRGRARTRDRMGGFAQQHGWEYAERDDSLVDVWDMAPFTRHHDIVDTTAHDVFTGRYEGRDMVAFHFTQAYRYERAHNIRRRTFSVIALDLDRPTSTFAFLPDDFLTDNELAALSEVLQDVSAEFDGQGVVLTDRPDLVHGVLHPALQETRRSFDHHAWWIIDCWLLLITRNSHSGELVHQRLATMHRALAGIDADTWSRVTDPHR